MIQKTKIIVTVLLVLAIGVLISGFLVYNGYIWFNNPDLNRYPVRGIDFITSERDRLEPYTTRL